MKKIVLLTAILVMAFTVNAFAAHSTTQTGDVTVTIPDIFHLTVTGGSLTQSFTVLEADVLTGTDQTMSNAFTLTAQSNINSTNLTAGRTAFAPVSPTPPSADGNFTLSTNLWDDNPTLTTAIPDIGSVTIKTGGWSNGVNDSIFGYKLSGISVADDPGTYKTTVTFTLSSSN